MPGNNINSPPGQQLIYFQFTMEAVGPVEELDGRRPIGSQDKSILPSPRAKGPK